MDERKPHINFELSQDTLGSAWQDLAEAIVLRSNTPTLVAGGSSPDGKRQPHQFTVQLSEMFMQEALLCVGDIPLKAEAQYLMEYRPLDDLDDSNTYEAVMVDWEYKVPELIKGKRVKVAQNLMVVKIRNGAEEQLEGGLSFEYSELQNGAWHRIDTGLHDFSVDDIDIILTDMPKEDRALEMAYRNLVSSECDLLPGDIETLHRTAQYIREQL